VSVTVGAVERWVHGISATMAALPAELDQAAPQRTFARVLEQAAAVLDTTPADTTPATTGPAATGPATTESLMPPTSPTASAVLTVQPLPPGVAPGVAGYGALSSPPGTAEARGFASGAAVVSEAEKFLGVPYVWGGDAPSGFDCSGLVQYVYSQLGISLPRTTYTQVKVGTPVASLTRAQPGDLVFFAGSDGTPTAPGHVGIYIGGGKMIDAPYTGTVVQVQTVTSAGPVVAIRRILPVTGVMTAPADLMPTGAAVFAIPTSARAGAVPANLAPLFLAAGARYGISPRLLEAIARQESGFTPDALSASGAEGMMQFMPGTAAGLGITPFTPVQAVDGAARLVSGYIRQFGSVPLALAAYNAGPAAVQEHGGIPPYSQTQAYVAAIMTTLGAAS
jgi:cell wall-associated NlpC family hydrolase